MTTTTTTTTTTDQGTGTGRPMIGPRDDTLLAHGSTGLLAEFNQAGVLGVADVRTADTIARICREPDETVRLACALAVVARVPAAARFSP